MKHIISGKQIEISNALKGHIENHLEAIIHKYFGDGIESVTTISPAPHQHFQVDISVHIGKGIFVQGTNTAADAYVAVDGAVARIARQLGRYKKRLKNHHKTHKEIGYAKAAQQYIVVQETVEEESDTLNPAIVAEEARDIPLLTVGEAVMRMDLEDANVFVFVNRAHNRVNFIYRRSDGHIGWIDPNLVE